MPDYRPAPQPPASGCHSHEVRLSTSPNTHTLCMWSPPTHGSCQTSSSGAVDYQQFLQLINWKDHPLPTHPNTVRSHPTIYLSQQRYGHMYSLSVQQACQDHGQVVGASLRAYLVWTILPSCLHCRHTISHFTTQHAAGYTCTYRTADNIGHAFHLQN